MKIYLLGFCLGFLIIFNATGQGVSDIQITEQPTGLAPFGPRIINSATNPIPNEKYPEDIAYAYVANDTSLSMPRGPIHFILNTPGNLTNIAPYTAYDFLSGASWALGEWYASVYSTVNNSAIVKVNSLTGNRTIINSGTGIGINGMAFDWTTNVLYAIAYNGTNSSLYTIDLSTGNPTLVGNNVGGLAIALGCNEQGNLFTVDMLNDNLVSINKFTSTGTIVGPLGFDASYAQDIEFDNTDNTMYYAAYNSVTGGDLRTIDLSTGATTLIGGFPSGLEVTGLAIQNFPFISYPHDIGVTAIISPVSSTTLGPSEHITIAIRNYGSSPQSNFPVQYTINGGAAVVEMCTGLSIPPGATLSYTFVTTVNMSLYGNYTINACTALVGDQNTSNDCKTAVVQKIMPAWQDTIKPQQLPYWTGSTDGNTFTQNSLIKVSSGNLEAGWVKFDISSIPDNTPINSAKVAYYVNYQYSIPSLQINHISSDPITASPATVLSEAQAGTNYISSTMALTPGWHTFDLPAMALGDISNATVQDWFALGFYENNNCTACFYGIIDGWDQAHAPYLLVDFGYIPIPDDVGISAISAPTSGAGLSSNENITVVIKNYGTLVQTNIPVEVSITGAGVIQTLSTVYPGILGAGATSTPFIVGAVDLHSFGNYSINACSNLAGDTNSFNNCKIKSVDNHCPLSVTSATSPLSGSNLTATEPLVVNLVNIGTSTLPAGTVLNYTITGSSTVFGSWSMTAPLAPGVSLLNQNIGTLDMHLYGTYTITICPFFPGNTYPNSGCFTYTVVHSIPIVNDTFRPQNFDFWTGSTNGPFFTHTSLMNLLSGNGENAWAKFDITSMPGGVQINSLNLHFYTISQNGNPNFNLNRLLTDPMSNTAPVVMNAIITGNIYLNISDGYIPGWHQYALGNAAKVDFLSQTDYNWFAVGFHEYETCPGCYTASIAGWQEPNEPYLEVNYVMPLPHDVGVDSVVLDPFIPIGPYIPHAMVRNYGQFTETFNVTMTSQSGYSSTIIVSNLAVGASITVAFSVYNATLGYDCLTASTSLSTDLNFGNNESQQCIQDELLPNVFGTVKYKNSAGTLMTDSTMVLLIYDNPPGLIRIDTVDANGNFMFENLPDGNYYLQVISQKAWGGCNASDALSILKHFVGMSLLSGLNLAAADVNIDGHVTSVDALMVLKRFTYLILGFPATDWISDMPFVTIPPIQYSATNLKVLCAGDVNGSFVP